VKSPKLPVRPVEMVGEHAFTALGIAIIADSSLSLKIIFINRIIIITTPNTNSSLQFFSEADYPLLL
jgi:hypothetical protein